MSTVNTLYCVLNIKKVIDIVPALISVFNFQQVKSGWIVSNGVVLRNEYSHDFLFNNGRSLQRKGSARVSITILALEGLAVVDQGLKLSQDE